MIRVTVRPSGCALWATFSVAAVVPLPEPGEMSAHVTSVRAVHAQPEPIVMVNWKRPPFHGRGEGTPLTLAEHPDVGGAGLGDGVGDGLGEGLVGVGVEAPSLSPPQAAAEMRATTRTTPVMCLVTSC